MPILKAIGKNKSKSNTKTKQTPSSLKRLLNYIARNNKNEQEKEKEVYKSFGIGLSDETDRAFRQIMFNKDSFDKRDGRQYKHYVISFDKGYNNLPVIEKIAKEFSEKSFLSRGFKGYVAIHKDKDHYHFHLVVDSVNFLNGYKLQELNSKNLKSERYKNKELKSYEITLQDLKNSMKEISLTYGIESPIKITETDKNKSINIAKMSKYKGVNKDNSFKTKIAKIWEEVVLEPTTNKKNLEDKLNKRGVFFNRFNPEDKYLSLKTEYIDENGIKKIGKVRLRTLEKDENYRFQATKNVYNWDFVSDELEKNLEKEKSIATFKDLFKKKEKELLLEKEMVKEIEEYKKDIKKDLEFLKYNKHYVKEVLKYDYPKKEFEEFSSKLIKLNSSEDTIKKQFEEMKELKRKTYSYFKPIMKEAEKLENYDYMRRRKQEEEEEKRIAEIKARLKREEEEQKAIEKAKQQQTPIPVMEERKLTAVEKVLIEQREEEEKRARERADEEKRKNAEKKTNIIYRVPATKKDKDFEF